MAILKIINNHSKSPKALKNIISYVLKESKTEDNLRYLHGEYRADQISPKEVFQDFMRVKKLFQKEDGRMYQHGTVSWHEDEAISYEKALSFGIELLEKLYPYHQVALAVHTDRNHPHIHFVVNSVSYVDGSMLHWSKKDLLKAKEESDRLCGKYGLSITRKGQHFEGTPMEIGTITAWNKDAYNLLAEHPKDSFLLSCVQAVKESIATAGTLEEFRCAMQQYGWDFIWDDHHKHITFFDDEGHKVRDTKLSKTFNIEINKGVLMHEFESNRTREPEAPDHQRSSGRAR